MRDRSDIQQAHDLLVGLLLHQSDSGLDVDESVNIAASTLCWVLGHTHNPYFEHTLEAIQRQAVLVLDLGTTP